MDETITAITPEGMTLFGRVLPHWFVFQINLSFVPESDPMK